MSILSYAYVLGIVKNVFCSIMLRGTVAKVVLGSLESL